MLLPLIAILLHIFIELEKVVLKSIKLFKSICTLRLTDETSVVSPCVFLVLSSLHCFLVTILVDTLISRLTVTSQHEEHLRSDYLPSQFSLPKFENSLNKNICLPWCMFRLNLMNLHALGPPKVPQG